MQSTVTFWDPSRAPGVLERTPLTARLGRRVTWTWPRALQSRPVPTTPPTGELAWNQRVFRLDLLSGPNCQTLWNRLGVRFDPRPQRNRHSVQQCFEPYADNALENFWMEGTCNLTSIFTG